MYVTSLNLTFGVTIIWCSAIFSKKDDFASSSQNKQWSKDLVGYFMDAVNTACGALPDWDFIWEQKMAIWQMSDLICICQRMKLDQTLQPWVQGLETITPRTSGQSGTGLLLLTQLFRQVLNPVFFSSDNTEMLHKSWLFQRTKIVLLLTHVQGHVKQDTVSVQNYCFLISLSTLYFQSCDYSPKPSDGWISFIPEADVN